MPVFKSKIATNSDSYSQNREDMLGLIRELRGLEERAVTASHKRLPTFKKRGQIPPHERMARILDPGMPFLQLHTLSNYLVEDSDPDTSIPGASIIAGIGFVCGTRCLVWVDDSGIRAGAYAETTVATAVSLQQIALRQKLPLLHLVESAGANLMGFSVENWIGAGGMFRNLALLSAAGIPTIAVLHGPSTAGGAYMPGLSDYVIGIRDNGMAALGGAALVRSATGEVADDRELGGTEMHASVSGLVEYLADDDAHGLELARELMQKIDWNKSANAALPKDCLPPRYAIDDLAGVVPIDYKTPYDVHEVLARIVDDSSIDDFKARYGAATVCAQVTIMGMACGVIGNNGPIDPDGATKVAQFTQLCDQANIPVIYLHNTTGYIVGTASEHAGMIKHGSKMVQAATNIRVPKISLYIGASFGAGNYGMCGTAYEPDFLFAWPNACINLMGGEQAAKTMSQVAEVKAERRGEEVDREALKIQEEQIYKRFKAQESAFYTAGRNLSHGVIDPRDTRKVLGFALATCLEARQRELRPNTFGVARL